MSSLAILHPTTLLGKELRDLLERRDDLGSRVRLLSLEDEEIGTLTQVRGEVALVQRGEAVELEGTDIAFFCGDFEATRGLLESLPATTTAILLSPDAPLGAGRPVVAGVSRVGPESDGVLLSPHPAAILLAHLLRPLRSLGLEEAVATIVQPVSHFGEGALDELFGEARRIIAMVEHEPIARFGRQLAFNLLPDRAPRDLVTAEVRAILEDDVPLAVQVLQGAVFHGLSLSLYLRLGGGAGAAEVRRALAKSPYLSIFDRPGQLGPIDAAAEEGILVGAIDDAPGRTGAVWMWAVMDNLTRGGALNAVEVAEAVLAAGGRRGGV